MPSIFCREAELQELNRLYSHHMLRYDLLMEIFIIQLLFQVSSSSDALRPFCDWRIASLRG
jgi:hypothetical protein